MSYSSASAAQDAQRRAYAALAQQYGNKIPWGVRKDFNSKWDAIVQQARLSETKAQNNPAVAYTNYTPQQKQEYDNRINTAAEAAKANPNYQDPAPAFDWEAWNAQMMAQQAAVMAQMDAMNSEFMRQQQEWMKQQEGRGRNSINVGAATPDGAQVKRKKRKRSSSVAARGVTNTGLGIASGAAAGVAGSGLSIGGA